MMNTSSAGLETPICCTPNEIYPPESFCYRNGSSLIGEIFTQIYLNFSIPAMFREFNCDGTIVYLEPYPPNNDEFTLMENGLIYVNKSVVGGTDFWLVPEEYCFTSRLTEYGRKSALSACNELEHVEVAVNLLSPGLLANLLATSVSLLCLVATFLVYTILPELKNVHGFTLRAYVASDFVLSTLLLIVLTNPPILCTYPIAIIIHFSILANYFQLNVMCFDIWRTFCSAALTGVGAIMDSVPNLPTGVITPGLRVSCWFINPAAMTIYLTGPISVTMICNICFFVLTAVKIVQHEKDTVHSLKGSDSQRHNDEKQRFYLYLKLFIVMGITFSTELVFLHWPDFPEYMLYIVELPNCLQGLNIFIIFVCKDKIIQLLLKRLGCKVSTPRPGTVEFGV